MNDIATIISTLGFPIVACIGLALFVKSMVDQNMKNIERMFTLYETANKENREAIEACTRAVDKLCEKIDKEVTK